MRTHLYLDGIKITQKEAKELYGEAQTKEYIWEAQKGFIADPNEQQSWYTSHGMLTVEFK